MKNFVIDNSLSNLGKTVLWQYDKARRLLALMKYMQVLYHCAVEQFWNYWINKVLSIDHASEFGCSLWGIMLGVSRPTVLDKNGNARLISTAVYRKVLKGAFYLMNANASFASLQGYISILFGIDGKNSISRWELTPGLEYGWSTNIDELNGIYQTGISYDKGTVVYQPSEPDSNIYNWEFTQSITVAQNSPWAAVAALVTPSTEKANVAFASGIAYSEGDLVLRDDGTSWVFNQSVSAEENTPWFYLKENGFVVKSMNPTTASQESDTLLLKLYDPEGNCCKIGGAPGNSLNISVSYEFGETTITAVVTRKRKCGVAIVDNYDMSMDYVRTDFYDEMHDDQKALFEQKRDELCPYPLGVKSNTPSGNWVFGFADQSIPQYEVGKAYAIGNIFWHEDSWDGCNWICAEDISAASNSSFEAIRGKLKKTFKGGPCLDTFAEHNPPYMTLRNCIYESFTPPNYVSTTVAPGRIAECLDGEMYKLYQNTTKGYLVVFHSAESDWAGLPPTSVANFQDWIFEPNPTAENIMADLALLMKRNNCSVISFGQVKEFMPDVLYIEGDVVELDGQERIVTRNGQCSSKEEFIVNSISQRRSCLHSLYPFKQVL